MKNEQNIKTTQDSQAAVVAVRLYIYTIAAIQGSFMGIGCVYLFGVYGIIVGIFIGIAGIWSANKCVKLDSLAK